MKKILLISLYFMFCASLAHAELLSVTGTGLERFYVYDTLGKELKGQTDTNSALNLTPGNYLVKLHNETLQVTLNAGQNLSIQTGTLQIKGKGYYKYSVYDKFARDSRVTNIYTDKSVVLLPGNYVVTLNNSSQAFSIVENKTIELTPGYIKVNGTGLDYYNVYDEFGREARGSYLRTNEEMEFFAGKYQVRLNGVSLAAQVQQQLTTEINAGRVRLNGIGLDHYAVYDQFGSSLIFSSRKTNSEYELFPGVYTLKINGTDQLITINENQLNETAVGLLVFPSLNQASYTLHDINGKHLSYSSYSAGSKLELFPDKYIIKNRDTSVETEITVNADLAQQPDPNFTDGYAAALVHCRNNPQACGISLGETPPNAENCRENPTACDLLTEAQVDTIKIQTQQACANDPTSCGITNNAENCRENPTACDLFTEAQVDAIKIQTQQACANDPTSCGIINNAENCRENPTACDLLTEAQVDAIKIQTQQACANDPTSCGITNNAENCRENPNACNLFTKAQVDVIKIQTQQACANDPASCGIDANLNPDIQITTLSSSLEIDIPLLSYQPFIGETQRLWAKLNFYANSPPDSFLFELKDYGFIQP